MFNSFFKKPHKSAFMCVRCYCAVHKTLKFLTMNAGSGSPEKAEAKGLIYNSRKGSISMTTFSRTARAVRENVVMEIDPLREL